ncbi:MAG: glycosyltransferase family 2 protein [Bacteroidales bacterium]|nr:glycosyltransferase family 2 protein [Bacteroidales bacterium]MCF8390565.1 glycosyltransferase family 2 protein [Bacteroidales bacterium]
MNISVVVPLFNEDESLPELVSWIKRVCQENQLSFEILLIDDGSNDNSWQVIHELSAENKEIKGVKFRQNYGKSAALHVGFQKALGDVVITMDADLQDSPDEIPGLYKMITEEGFDIVSGWKKKRFDPISKTIPSKLYNWTARKVTGIALHDFNCGLKAYRNKVVKSIEVYGEMHRYIPVIANRAGFKKIGEKVVQHQERKYGITKFGLERFINGFLDLMTISFISRFGKRPMHMFGTLGTLVFIVGFLSAVWLGAQKLYLLHKGIKTILITDSPYFYLSLAAMIIGSQLFVSGFIGELVARSSTERNQYFIDEEIKA